MDYVILCGSNRRTKQKLQQKTKKDEQQGPHKTRVSPACNRSPGFQFDI